MFRLSFFSKQNFWRRFELTKSLLGFEFWEVLTAFTLAFTVASAVIWFSKYQPKQVQKEFVQQEQTKSKLYNLKLQGDNSVLYSTKLINTYKTGQKCFNLTRHELDSQAYEERKTELQNIEDKMKSVEIETKLTTFHIDSTNFIRLSDSFDNYILDLEKDLEKEHYLAKIIIDIQPMLIEFCEADFDLSLIDSTKVSNFVKELEKNTTEKSKTTTLAQIYHFETKLLQIQKTNLQQTHAPELSESIAGFFQDFDFDEILNYDSLNSGKESVQALEDFEIWQKNFIVENKVLAQKVVFITDV